MGSPRFEKLLQNVRKFPDMGEKTKVHSSHLYQLYAYLRNAERKRGWERSDGMVLYPAVSHSFDITASELKTAKSESPASTLPKIGNLSKAAYSSSSSGRMGRKLCEIGAASGLTVRTPWRDVPTVGLWFWGFAAAASPWRDVPTVGSWFWGFAVAASPSARTAI